MSDNNWLKPYHYQALVLPRRDLQPTDVLYRGTGDFNEKVGNLPMLFSSQAVPPAVSRDEDAGSIARDFSKNVELSLGAKILGAILGGAASSQLGANLEAKHVASLSVTYQDVTIDSIAVLELETWLSGTRINAGRQAVQWLNNNKLAAVTAVLRTATLSVAAKREDGGSIELSIPEIQGIVSGQAKVAADSSDSSKVTFAGKEPIAFGFQAYVMLYEGMVSFGLEALRDLAAPDERMVSAAAWTADDEVELTDGELPGG